MIVIHKHSWMKIKKRLSSVFKGNKRANILEPSISDYGQGTQNQVYQISCFYAAVVS